MRDAVGRSGPRCYTLGVTATILLALSLAALAAPAPGQLLASRDNPLAVGRHQLNVTDVGAHRKFWGEMLGAEFGKFEETDVAVLENALLFLEVQDPAGGSNGSTVNHLGYRVPDLPGLVGRLKAAGYEIITTEVVATATQEVHYNPDQDVYLAFVRGPDDIRVELMENKELDGTVAHHIHIFTEDDGAARDWYVRHFGGKPGMRGRFKTMDIPGIELAFAPSDSRTEATKGRVVDHIGFEIDDLEAFCRKLEGQGIRFDVPFRRIERTGLSVAFLTDPWGTYIELTEGLDRF